MNAIRGQYLGHGPDSGHLCIFDSFDLILFGSDGKLNWEIALTLALGRHRKRITVDVQKMEMGKYSPIEWLGGLRTNVFLI